MTRQVRYSQTNPGEEIDMVLFVNGLPLITIELKNAWTGQTARYHGQKQYRDGRDATQPLLQFGRALVHMAVDTDEVFMTTKLAGPATFFLPFNKGHEQGEGNPPNPNGHKTAYLWGRGFHQGKPCGHHPAFRAARGQGDRPIGQEVDDLPALSPVGGGAPLAGPCGHDRRGAQLSDPAFGRFRQVELDHLDGLSADRDLSGRAKHPGAKGLDQPLFDSVIVVTDRRRFWTSSCARTSRISPRSRTSLPRRCGRPI